MPSVRRHPDTLMGDTNQYKRHELSSREATAQRWTSYTLEASRAHPTPTSFGARCSLYYGFFLSLPFLHYFLRTPRIRWFVAH